MPRHTQDRHKSVSSVHVATWVVRGSRVGWSSALHTSKPGPLRKRCPSFTRIIIWAHSKIGSERGARVAVITKKILSRGVFGWVIEKGVL